MTLWVPHNDSHADLSAHDSFSNGARILSLAACAAMIRDIPQDYLSWRVDKGNALIANTGPDFTDHVLDAVTTDEFRMKPFNSPAGTELYACARDLIALKTAAGDTDGIPHLILKLGPYGSVICDSDCRNFFYLLVAAGNDITRYSIAAEIQALCHQPELLAAMKNGPVWDTAPDETIRRATLALHFRRTAMADENVVYRFAAGNRNETAFEGPFRVDLGRSPNRHLSVGQGGAACLSGHVARAVRSARVVRGALKMDRRNRRCRTAPLFALQFRGRDQIPTRHRPSVLKETAHG